MGVTGYRCVLRMPHSCQIESLLSALFHCHKPAAFTAPPMRYNRFLRSRTQKAVLEHNIPTPLMHKVDTYVHIDQSV